MDTDELKFEVASPSELSLYDGIEGEKVCYICPFRCEDTSYTFCTFFFSSNYILFTISPPSFYSVCDVYVPKLLYLISKTGLRFTHLPKMSFLSRVAKRLELGVPLLIIC